MKALLHMAGLVYESEPAFPVFCIPVNLSQFLGTSLSARTFPWDIIGLVFNHNWLNFRHERGSFGPTSAFLALLISKYLNNIFVDHTSRTNLPIPDTL